MADRPTRYKALVTALRAIQQGSLALMERAQLGLATEDEVVELEHRAAVVEVLREMEHEEGCREGFRALLASESGHGEADALERRGRDDG